MCLGCSSKKDMLNIGNKIYKLAFFDDFKYTPNYVKYYMNGKEVKNLDTSKLPKGPVNIWMTSIASWLGGTKSVDDSKLPGTAIFDYVKYYELTH